MGLFNRSNKPKSGEGDASSSSSGSSSAGDAIDGLKFDQPRCRHYVFAHVALRNVAFEYPVEIIAALGSEKAGAMLDDLWQSVDEACIEQGDDQHPVDKNAVQIHRVQIGDFPTAVIAMPEPMGATEAHFVAIVLCVNPREAGLSKEDIVVRYFTLEQGAKLSAQDADRNVLCEWTADGSHVNLGDGPPAELAMFVSAVRSKLA